MLALSQEVETLLVAFVEKGAGVEADVLASVVSLLPQEVKEQLPNEVCIPVCPWHALKPLGVDAAFHDCTS